MFELPSGSRFDGVKTENGKVKTENGKLRVSESMVGSRFKTTEWIKTEMVRCLGKV